MKSLFLIFLSQTLMFSKTKTNLTVSFLLLLSSKEMLSMVMSRPQISWLCVIITPGGEHIVPLPLARASIYLDLHSANRGSTIRRISSVHLIISALAWISLYCIHLLVWHGGEGHGVGQGAGHGRQAR